MSFGITFYLGLNMTHPHAEILRAIADGVPLSEFEVTSSGRCWLNVKDAKITDWVFRDPQQWQVRRKPRTHVVNGFTVPAPMDKAPEFGDMYFIPDVLDEIFYAGPEWGQDYSTAMRWLKRGLLFATKDAAIANAKAMLKIDPEAA